MDWWLGNSQWILIVGVALVLWTCVTICVCLPLIVRRLRVDAQLDAAKRTQVTSWAEEADKIKREIDEKYRAK